MRWRATAPPHGLPVERTRCHCSSDGVLPHVAVEANQFGN